ncbi:hypothetical protein JCM5296_002580 [Sporobolomyces johnsonii]
METEPSTAAPSPSAFPDFAAFQDLLASHPSPSTGNGTDDLVANGHVFSPGQQNFADLLAEFTLPGNAMSAMSPQGGDPAMGRTPDAQDHHQRAASEGAAHAKSVQEALMDQLKMSYAQPNGQGPAHGQPSTGAPSPVSPVDGAAPNGGIDFQMQLQQLLASTLASSTGSQTPTPTQHAPSPQHHHQQQHFAAHLQQHQHSPHSHSHGAHYSAHSSPSGLHSQPPSHAASPMAMYQYPATTSVPSAAYTPVAVSSPYIVVPPGYVGPLPQGIAVPAAYAQQFAVQGEQQQQAVDFLAQAQAFMQANQGQTVRDGASTSTSHATSADGEWRENEFMFSPLMSPAMTPHTPFTAASSRPPSVGPLPLVSPADCFPPLTSPALGPQLYSSDHRVQHRNSLQGLVDGVGALTTQLPPGSPSSFYQSPRIGPNDAGSTTAAGSGRRGAGLSSKKTRPSPLIKPTDPTLDHRRRRKPTNPGAASQNGATSATSSPFLGATNPSSSGGRAASTPGGVSASSGSQKASPPEHTSAYSNGSIDTPSPVDLAGPPSAGTGPDGLPVPPASVYGSLQQQPPHQHLPQQPYQLEPMGPPPPPSSQQHQSFNPVTPATIMNFASGFDLDALSSLSPHLGPTTHDPAGSAYSSVQNSPMLLPQPDSSLPGTASSAGKARSSRKSTSAKPSPALRPVDAKGKGKGNSTDSGTPSSRKGASKPAKIAPSPRIGPSPKIRPLLSSDAAPDAQARLASKSNYENILEGRGSDLLGLAPSTLTALQGPSTASGSADNRRSTHKIAEQKRRDSLKLCFDELRKLLPPILPSTADDADRRPGEGNVGGQRNGEVDPDNPNKGVSKVALLRRSNEYLDILRERIERRDRAIAALRAQNMMLREQSRKAGRLGMQQEEEQEEEDGEDGEEVPGLDLDLDNIDKEERRAGNLAFYEDLDFEAKIATLATLNRRPSTSGGRRPSATPAPPKAVGTRRSSRTAQNAAASEATAMDVEDA